MRCTTFAPTKTRCNGGGRTLFRKDGGRKPITWHQRLRQNRSHRRRRCRLLLPRRQNQWCVLDSTTSSFAPLLIVAALKTPHDFSAQDLCKVCTQNVVCGRWRSARRIICFIMQTLTAANFTWVPARTAPASFHRSTRALQVWSAPRTELAARRSRLIIRT